MMDTLTDALAIIAACLFVAILAVAAFLYRPARRRHRHRKRHSRRPKIDLFAEKGSDPTAPADA